MVELDYLVIGHVTQDLKGSSFTIGGTASYAARTALALGCRVGVVTSAHPHLDLSSALGDALVARFPAPTTTTFENIYSDSRRHQVVHGVAETLGPAAVPSDWQAATVHVGPVAQECDPALVEAFEDAFVGVTPQGWMRRWDQDGRVSHRSWQKAERVLARADALVLSEEDLEDDESVVAWYAAQVPVLALTRAAAGCTVYAGGQVRHLPAPDVREVNSTGAGDVFAAPFFVWLRRTGDPWMAARFANCIASRSVTRLGLLGAPTPEEVARCKRALSKDKVGYAHHLRTG